MALIASQSKAGYYPTPVKELRHIIPHLAVQYSDNAHIINALDPCCGRGEALNIIASAIRKRGQSEVVTYGIELETGRAAAASSVLDYVVNDTYDLVRTEPKYGVMWLNPPYNDINNERSELLFLKTLTSQSRNVLQQGALMMFCIPQHVLKPCGPILSQRFKDIRVYRFTDHHFHEYSQVVVFAYFRKPTIKEMKDTHDYLKLIAESDPDDIPTLEEIDEGFIIPSHEEPVTLFRAGRLNIKEVAKDLAESMVLEEFQRKTTQIVDRAIMKSPLLPLKSTHMAIAVASGAISGNLGTHIVTGVTKKEIVTQELYNDEGENYGQKKSQYYNSAVRVFTPQGIYELS